MSMHREIEAQLAPNLRWVKMPPSCANCKHLAIWFAGYHSNLDARCTKHTEKGEVFFDSEKGDKPSEVICDSHEAGEPTLED